MFPRLLAMLVGACLLATAMAGQESLGEAARRAREKKAGERAKIRLEGEGKADTTSAGAAGSGSTYLWSNPNARVELPEGAKERPGRSRPVFEARHDGIRFDVVLDMPVKDWSDDDRRSLLDRAEESVFKYLIYPEAPKLQSEDIKAGRLTMRVISWEERRGREPLFFITSILLTPERGIVVTCGGTSKQDFQNLRLCAGAP